MHQKSILLFVAAFLIAVGLNFLLEMSQSALFAPMGGTPWAMWRCFVASLGDGVIIIAIAAIGALLFRRLDWFVRPGRAGYVFMAVFGGGRHIHRALGGVNGKVGLCRRDATDICIERRPRAGTADSDSAACCICLGRQVAEGARELVVPLVMAGILLQSYRSQEATSWLL